MRTNSFTKPEIFQISKLELSYHPNFEMYFKNPNIPESGYWFLEGNENNAKLDSKLIEFLNIELNGRVVEFCPSGDFQGIIKVEYGHFFSFFEEDSNKDTKYFHICEEGNGTALSKYIIYTDSDDEQYNIDGIHEQTISIE